MATVQGTTGGAMLQGVSQQPARLRVDGQVTKQVNMDSNVSKGLSSRPGYEFVADLEGAAGGWKFRKVSLEGKVYTVGWTPGELRLWNLQGGLVELDEQNSNFSPSKYIGGDMSFGVHGSNIYFTNRDMPVESSTEKEYLPFHVAIATALGGNFSRTYRIDIEWNNRTASGTYTTPSGDSDGDADKSNSTSVIKGLYDSIIGKPYVNSELSVQVEGPVLKISSTTHKVYATVDDEDGGTLLKITTDTAEKSSDLPKYAPHGTLVKIVGDGADEDNFYLRFNASTTSVVGSGFGSEGVWEEWLKTGEEYKLDASTMPHVLSLSSNGKYTINEGAWENRRVGDADSNPMPSFVGLPIRDIGGFESRLTFVAGPNAIMSRTGEPLDFFRRTATAIIDSDPIDMRSTKDGSATLDWIVPFDRDLILLSDPGDSQFVITGGGLTPSNASMVLTTSFEMFGYSRPVTTGSTMLFPFKSGIYSGVKEFFTTDSMSTNTADTITEVQDRYITGSVTSLDSSKNFNTVILTTDDENNKSIVWVYKYLWDGNKRLQSSWSTWDLYHEVLALFFDNSEIYFVINRGQSVALVKINMNLVEDELLGYHVCLDMKRKHTVSGGKITLDYEGASFVQREGCPYPGEEATPTIMLRNEDTFDYHFESVYTDGMEFITGLKFERIIEPTMPRLKDQKGSTISNVALNIGSFNVHVEDTGEFSVTMQSPYRDDFTFTPSRYPLDDDPFDKNRTMVNTGAMYVPWGERSDYSKLKIHSTDVRPMTLLEVEFQAQVTGRRRRV